MIVRCQLCHQYHNKELMSFFIWRDKRLHHTTDPKWRDTSGTRILCAECVSEIKTVQTLHAEIGVEANHFLKSNLLEKIHYSSSVDITRLAVIGIFESEKNFEAWCRNNLVSFEQIAAGYNLRKE